VPRVPVSAPRRNDLTQERRDAIAAKVRSRGARESARETFALPGQYRHINGIKGPRKRIDFPRQICRNRGTAPDQGRPDRELNLGLSMNKKTFPRLARIAVFAAITLTSATIFATQLEPIAPGGELDRGPLLQPINAPGDIQPAAAVPEPTTWGMLVLGAGLLAGVRRFRRK
jgi:hypothetical protein